MATLTAQKITDTGTLAAVTSASAAGDEFLNTGLEFLFFQNVYTILMFEKLL